MQYFVIIFLRNDKLFNIIIYLSPLCFESDLKNDSLVENLGTVGIRCARPSAPRRGRYKFNERHWRVFCFIFFVLGFEQVQAPKGGILSPLRCESDLRSMAWWKIQERSGFATRIPLRPSGGATNSMNDTGVSIVSFLCTSALSKLKPSHKKMKRLRLAS